MRKELEVISRDEIRLDAQQVRIVWEMKDSWGRRIVDSVVLDRPLKRGKASE